MKGTQMGEAIAGLVATRRQALKSIALGLGWLWFPVLDCFGRGGLRRGRALRSALSGGGAVKPNRAVYLKFTATENGVTVRLDKIGVPAVAAIDKSTDGLTWDAYAWGEYSSGGFKGEEIALSKGKSVFFAAAEGGNDKLSNGLDAYYKFTIGGGTAAVAGDVSGLLDSTAKKNAAPNYCFCRLFKDCPRLASAPDVSFDSVGEYGCYEMFSGCSALVLPPRMNATVLGKSCFRGMFNSCTSLVKAPELPATALATGCYYSMFTGCASLVEAPELPAKSMKQTCYQSMFAGCTALERAPYLPSVEIASSCYASMFSGCSNLSYVQTEQGSTSSYSTENWLLGVALNGVFKCKEYLTIGRGPSGVPEGWTMEVERYKGLSLTCETAGTEVKLIRNGIPPDIVLEISGDKGKTWRLWTEYEGVRSVTMPSVGTVLLLRGLNETISSADGYYYFSFSNRVSASGNVMSLLDPEMKRNDVPPYCFAHLFEDPASQQIPIPDVGLTTPPELPATELSEHCYEKMFAYMYKMKSAPVLPATALAPYCYSYMFAGNWALESPPELPATSLAPYCCQYMFTGCSKFTRSPELLSADLFEGCYKQMFRGCGLLAIVSTRQKSFVGCENWLREAGLSVATHTFRCPAELGTNETIERGNSACPVGWTVENS